MIKTLKLLIDNIPFNKQTLKYELSIVAIVKNEVDYLIEWIAYHKLIGVEHFYIADNTSNDGSRQLLHKLQQQGILTLVDWPIKNRAQHLWYNHAIESFAHDTQYMLFIDIDEFLISQKPFELKKSLLSLISRKNVGAVAINWRIMGSGGAKVKTPGLVLKRFTTSSVYNHKTNRHIKSLIKPTLVDKMWAHSAELKQGALYLLPSGEEVSFFQDNPKSGRTQTIKDTDIIVRHYAVKSLEEFIENKKNKGGANQGAEAIKNMSYFDNHDVNDEVIELPDSFLIEVEAYMNELKSNLILLQKK